MKKTHFKAVDAFNVIFVLCHAAMHHKWASWISSIFFLIDQRGYCPSHTVTRHEEVILGSDAENDPVEGIAPSRIPGGS